ncbi:peptidylprolyl isomerase [Pseudomonadota bacterium]
MLLLAHMPLLAQESAEPAVLGASTEVFASQGGVVLTQGELDAAFLRIPPEYRLRFIRDGERVDNLVSSLLRTKLIAADAASEGFEQDSMIQKRMQLATEKELAEAWIENLLENAPEADYEALALEYYLAHPDEFQSPGMVDVSHILISSENRSKEEALVLATSIRENLQADPSQFDLFVEEFSEDPAKANNGGRYPNTQRGQMMKAFEDAAFALQQAGDISEPVETSYGYHLIKLNKAMPPETVPFEQIREQAIKLAKEQYLAQYRVRYIQKQIAEPIVISEGAVEIMVKRYFGEELELVPEFLK